jgi:Peptidase family M28
MINKSFLKLPLFLFGILCLLVSCGGGNNTNTNTTPVTTTPVATVKAPVFSGDSAYAYTAKQVEFGPRMPNTKEHDACAKWLEDEMNKYADKVILQTGKVKAFDGKQLNFTNIMASFNPQNGNRIVLTAHWDTRPWADQDSNPANHNKPILGANDAASGAGVLIEIARLLKQNKVNIGVDLVLFDIEDYGQPEGSGYAKEEDTYGLGSQYWSKNLPVPGYQAKYGILLDMVGGKNSTFRMEGYSMEYAPELVKKVWTIASEIGYGNYFLQEKAPPIQDDHYYMNVDAGIPTIDIIPLDQSNPKLFHPVWHTLHDNMENIDKDVLKAVGQTLTELIYREDKGVS